MSRPYIIIFRTFAENMEAEKFQKGVTVYCASATKVADKYFSAAEAVGRQIAAAGVPLITGAGNMGLMGAVNNAATAAGGVTIGVIPQFMVERGWHHKNLTHLEITPDMHTRKALMAQLAKGIIALPGGIGTFEELCEIITWRQLGLFHGNIAVLNTAGYYDTFDAMIGHAIAEGFLPSGHRQLYTLVSTPAEAVKTALGENSSGGTTFSPKF